MGLSFREFKCFIQVNSVTIDLIQVEINKDYCKMCAKFCLMFISIYIYIYIYIYIFLMEGVCTCTHTSFRYSNQTENCWSILSQTFYNQ